MMIDFINSVSTTKTVNCALRMVFAKKASLSTAKKDSFKKVDSVSKTYR